jgi:hypothetical protein
MADLVLSELTGERPPFVAGTFFDLGNVGYQQAEYALSGTARAYGRGAAGPEVAEEAPFSTRVIVYRPADAPRPVTVVAFRSHGPELVALTNSGPPFVNAGWGRDAIGMVLDSSTDWTEVQELLTESYAALAPKGLRAQLDRPD